MKGTLGDRDPLVESFARVTVHYYGLARAIEESKTKGFMFVNGLDTAAYLRRVAELVREQVTQ